MNVTRHYHSQEAFTLIELLVVVAIIAILVTIAVINFQNAQTRGKVATTLNDMRVISGALETYRVDHQSYPPAAIGDFQLPDPLITFTSPVPYLNGVPCDPFGLASFDFNPALVMLGYNYKDKKTTSVGMPAETYGHIWAAFPEKEYFIHSCGPNRIWDVSPYVEYDPTNGVVSVGDICRFGPM